MRNLLISVFISFGLFSAQSIACSFAPGYYTFETEPEGFEMKMDKGLIAILPAPQVQIDKITRGSAAPGSSCDDAGMIHITIKWPSDSVYTLDEIGFYFQSENGLEPDLIFPLGPVRGKPEGNEVKFFFVWLDGHPKYQKPLNFNLNVFAINKGLQIGQPTTVKIEAGKG
ncbi:hypothetical protein [Microbulbifer aestuariivivens]